MEIRPISNNNYGDFPSTPIKPTLDSCYLNPPPPDGRSLARCVLFYTNQTLSYLDQTFPVDDPKRKYYQDCLHKDVVTLQRLKSKADNYSLDDVDVETINNILCDVKSMLSEMP